MRGSRAILTNRSVIRGETLLDGIVEEASRHSFVRKEGLYICGRSDIFLFVFTLWASSM